MSTLAEFLLARIAEDERSAQAVADSHAMWDWESYVAGAGMYEEPASDYAQRMNPARVLAECEAKRRIVVLHSEVDEGGGLHLCHEWLADDTQCGELRALASVYAAHPDYRDGWRA